MPYNGNDHQSGNIFFTLFGAIALVGVIGAATTTLVRGPLSTVSAVNMKAKVDTQLAIASKLATIAAAQMPNGGNCDYGSGDTYIEPLHPVTGSPAPVGGGQLPSSVGAAQVDPWGTPLGYCVWDLGAAPAQVGDPLCAEGAGEVAYLDGGHDSTQPVFVVLSAGPDRAFQTSCEDWADNVGAVGPPSNASTLVNKPASSDDIIAALSYQEAQNAADGLWSITAGDPNTITTDKNVAFSSGSVQFASGTTATFQGTAQFAANSKLDLGFAAGQAGLFLLPDDTELLDAECTVANNGVLRINVTDFAPSTVLEMCDASLPGTFQPLGGAGVTVSNLDDLGDAAAGTDYLFLGAGAGLAYDSASGSNNLGVGINAASTLVSGSDNIVIGNGARTFGAGTTDSIVIGHGIVGGGNDTLQIGGFITGSGIYTSAGTLDISGSVEANLFRFDSNLYIDDSAGGMVLATGGAPRVTIDGSGNVSIASSGGVELTVNGDVNVTGDTESDQFIATGGGAAGTPGFTFDGYTSSGLFYNSGAGLGFSIGGSSEMELDAGGLRVHGIGVFDDYGTFAGYVQGDNFQFNGSTNSGLFFTSGTGMGLNYAGTSRVFVGTGGNVGISNTNPQVELDVSGAIRPAATTATCAGGSIYGAIRYASGDLLEMCSSIANDWVTIGTSGGGGGGTGSLWTNNTSYITRGSANMINTGVALPAGLTGAGSRMLWYPDKSAFRAGEVTGGQWDDANIGSESAAFGLDNTASGDYSFAAGRASTASDLQSMALGYAVTSSGDSSFGAGSLTSATGDYSVALGLKATASGLRSFAFGLGDPAINPVVSANNSFGIFMGDQSGINLNTANTMLLAGGSLVIDPDTTSATNIAPSRAGLNIDVEGDIGAIQYCDEDGNNCFTASSVASGSVGVPGFDREIIYNSNGTFWTTPGFVFSSTGFLGIGNASPEASLDIGGTGAILLPRGVTGDRPAGINGMLRYNSASGKFEGFQGGGWFDIITNGGGGLGIDDLNDAIAFYASGNMHFGQGSGDNLTTGSANTSVGVNALAAVTSGDGNSGFGADTLQAVTSGDHNTALGYSALNAVSSGFGNIAIGAGAGDQITTGSNNIIIGYGQDAANNTGSNQLNIGGVLTGDLVTGNMSFNGTAALRLPGGTTAERPASGENGMIRYNSQTGKFEAYQAGAWEDIITGAAITSFLNLTDTPASYAGASKQFLRVNTAENAVEFTDELFETVSAGAAPFADFNDLDDVVLPTPNDGDVVSYDSASGTWVNTPIASLVAGAAAPDRAVQFNSGGAFTGSGSLVFTSASILDLNGALRLSGTGTDTFITPNIGSDIPTKINIPVYDPGNFGQIIAMGLPAAAPVSARAISMLDARAGSHQPTIGVFNVNEYDMIGFSWDGSNSTGYIKTLSGDIGFRVDSTDILRLSSSGGNITMYGTGALTLPRGDTAQRPGTPVNGMLRYNSANGKFEGYQGGAWQDILTGSASAAAPDRGIQFNSGGSFAASSNFTWDATNNLNVLGTSTFGAANTTDGTITVAGHINVVPNGSGESLINVTNSNDTGYSALELYNSDVGGQNWQIVSGGNNNSGGGGSSITEGNLLFWNKTTDNIRMAIAKTTGNVAIGDQLPQARLDVQGTDAILLPRGVNGNRPASPVNGMLRYNSQTGKFEGYQGGAWQDILTSAVAGGASAPDRGLQFNSGGNFAASANLTYTAGGNLQIDNGNLDIFRSDGIATSTLVSSPTFGAWGQYNIYSAGFAKGWQMSMFEGSATDGDFNIGHFNGATTDSALSINYTTLDVVLDQNLIVNGTGALTVPRGTTAQRPGTGVNGMLRYNSQSGKFEAYQAGSWQDIVTGAAISTFLSLTDTPASYAASGGMFVKVNAGATALEFTDTVVNTVSGQPAPTGLLLDDLGDVDLTVAPTDGQILQYVSASGTWQAASGGSIAMAIDDLTDAKTDYVTGHNLFMGNNAGNAIGAGVGNTVVGEDAGDAITTGNYNTALGWMALGSTTTGVENVALGESALISNIDGVQNVAVGTNALNDNTVGHYNTSVGYQALRSNVGGYHSTAIGYDAMRYANDAAATFITYNTAVGSFALRGSATPANNTGTDNTAVGHGSLQNNTSGTYNTAVGVEALFTNTTGSWNAAFGHLALRVNTTGAANTAFGQAALENTTTGINNTALGMGAGGNLVSGSNNIAIGYGVAFSSSTVNYQLNIGDLITGTLNAGLLEINGTGALTLPRGTTAQRPGTGVNGMLRYNSQSGKFEGYQAGAWQDLLTGAATSSFISLTDTPASYAGSGTMFVRVNTAENALEFTDEIVESVTGQPAPNYLALNDLSDVDLTVAPTQGQALVYDSGSGVWVAGTVGGVPGGADTQVQFNSGGAFGGSANFTWDNATSTLTLGGPVNMTHTSALTLPRGTTAERPAGTNGMLRYNSQTGKFEGYQGGSWQDIVTGAAVSTFLSLTDTPASYAGSAGKFTRVNAGATALEFTDEFIETVTGQPVPASSLLDDLGDVDLTVAPTDGQFLKYDSASGLWIAASIAAAGAAAPDRGIQFNSGGSFAGDANLVYTSAGWLGLGLSAPDVMLDIAGEARIGNTALACAGAVTGALRYNSASTRLEMCDGATWRALVADTLVIDLVVTPSTVNNMNVTGCGTPPCNGTPVVFTVQNQGASTSAVMATSVSNATNFVITSDTCNGNTLGAGLSCQVEVTPRSSGNESFTGLLNIAANNNPFSIMQGTSSGFGCSPGVVGAGGVYVACGLNDGDGAYDLIAMPGGCDGTTLNPTCSGTDGAAIQKTWGTSGFLPGVCITNDFTCKNAQNAVNIIAAKTVGAGAFPAAEYCDAMNYNGKNDWYLPNQDELASRIYPEKNAGNLTGFQNSFYWSSTESSASSNATKVSIANGSSVWDNTASRNNTNYVRCVRRENLPLPTATADTDPANSTTGFKMLVTETSGARMTSTETITISDILQPVTISVSGAAGNPRLTVNGGAEIANGTANWGDVIAVVMDAPTVAGTMNTATVSLGPDNYTYKVAYADPAKESRIFVTDAEWSGSMGGLGGTDTKCTNAANAAAIGGTWVALTSTVATPALDRVPWNWGVLKRLDGTVVANSWGDLWDGSILAPINITENMTTEGKFVWTGTDSDGLTSGTDICAAWTTTGSGNDARRGDSSATGTNWVSAGSAGTCSPVPSQALYCVESVAGGLPPGSPAIGLDDLSDVDLTTTPPGNGQTIVYNSASGLWVPGAASGGAMDFVDLTDTPASYAGSGGLIVKVNAGATALEFSNDLFTSVTGQPAPTLPNIEDLGNVDMTVAPTDGQALVYDSAAGNWIAGAGGGGASTFLALTDTPASYAGAGGMFVKVNAGATGVEFVNTLINTVSGAAAPTGMVLDDLDDVVITAVANGDFVVHNGTNWVNPDNISWNGTTFNVTGNITYTGTLHDVSDMRLKTDIHPLRDRGSMLDKFAQIDTYSFRMKDDAQGGVEFGVMAQEINKVFPELVAVDENAAEQYMSVNYVGLIAPLIEASKELKAENDNLKAELASIQTAMVDIQGDIRGLKAHTGYGINKASIGFGMVIGMIAAFLSGAVFLSVSAFRRQRRQTAGQHTTIE